MSKTTTLAAPAPDTPPELRVSVPANALPPVDPGRSVHPERLLAVKRAASARFLDPKKDLADNFRSFYAAAYASADPEENVAGVGIGRRLRSGKLVDEWCVRIYVERKIDREALPSEFVLPTKIDGISVDVVESGRFIAFSMPEGRKRLRPAQPGCSVGARLSTSHRLIAGTLGALALYNGGRCLLSNNHVLNPDNLADATGVEVFQPGTLDATPSSDPIARVVSARQVRAGYVNFMDCAIAEVVEDGAVSPEFLSPIKRLSATNPVDPVDGMLVEKVGRTTGYTRGKIVDSEFDARVWYPHGTYVFQNQFAVQGHLVAGQGPLSVFAYRTVNALARIGILSEKLFSDSGDSGAVVVDRASKRAVGLLVGGGTTSMLSVASPIERILQNLNIELIV